MGITRNVKLLAGENALDDLATTIAMTKIGTTFYMAPEISFGDYDEKVDCFAWGQVALNCHKICGFVGPKTLIDKVTDSEISAPFLSVIKDALQQDADLRPSSERIVELLKDKIFAPDPVKKMPKEKDQPLDIMFFGNVGVGKSTLISNVSGASFEAGTSFAGGKIPDKVYKEDTKGRPIRWFDTAGLTDVKAAETAAKTIHDALLEGAKQGRNVKLISILVVIVFRKIRSRRAS